MIVPKYSYFRYYHKKKKHQHSIPVGPLDGADRLLGEDAELLKINELSASVLLLVLSPLPSPVDYHSRMPPILKQLRRISSQI
jgi:hypothetical protein